MSPEQGHLNSMSPPCEYVSAPEMGIEVWVPTNVVRPPERHVSPSVGFVYVMSPLVDLLSPSGIPHLMLGRRTAEFKPSKKKESQATTLHNIQVNKDCTGQTMASCGFGHEAEVQCLILRLTK